MIGNFVNLFSLKGFREYKVMFKEILLYNYKKYVIV